MCFHLDWVLGARMTGTCLWWEAGSLQIISDGQEQGLPGMISLGG